MSSQLTLVKLVVNTVSALGTYKVIDDIIKANTSVVTTADAVRVWSGGIVLSAIVADHASTYVNARLDALSAWLEQHKQDSSPEK